MGKKSSASSQLAGLKSMKSEDIKNKQWTEQDRLGACRDEIGKFEKVKV